MTAIECTDLDDTFSTFSLCSLKPINRTLKLLSLRIILHRPPVTNSSFRFKVLKKDNYYKPYGMDVYLDACKYLNGKKNPAVDWFFNIWQPYTNINHSCPFNQNLIIHNVPIMNLPLPSVFLNGRYRVDFEVYAYNKPRALLKLFVDVVEK